MSEAEPSLAVIIPTRSRYTRLAFCLEGLAQQTVAGTEFEVIVVCDEDDPPPPSLPPAGLPLRIVIAPPRSTPAAKRNLGWQAAQARVIAFTDDDCRPSPGWIEALLAAAADADGTALLQGPVGPDPDELHLLTGLARSLHVVEGEHWYPTANLSLSRRLLERLDGFDEDFRRAGGEDTDLALRSIASGARPRFARDAVVWHAVHTRSLRGALSDASRADGVALLFRRHPEQRQQIYAGLFWKRAHALALLGAAGLLGLRRRPMLAALAMLPYLRANFDTSVRITPKHLVVNALHLPVRMLVDLAETLATARGAVKARTPLL